MSNVHILLGIPVVFGNHYKEILPNAFVLKDYFLHRVWSQNKLGVRRLVYRYIKTKNISDENINPLDILIRRADLHTELGEIANFAVETLNNKENRDLSLLYRFSMARGEKKNRSNLGSKCSLINMVLK